MEILGWLLLIAPFVGLYYMLRVRQDDTDRCYGPQGNGGNTGQDGNGAVQ